MTVFYRVVKALATTIFGVFVLVSCEVASPPAEDTASPIPVVSEANVNELAKLVAELKNVVGIRDYAQANVVLSQVRETWAQVEADIKLQQPAKHEAIEIHISSLEKNLKLDQPSTTTILSDLKLLETVVYNLSR